MENNQASALSKEEIEIMELAVKLSKEVIQEMRIENISNFVPQKHDAQTCKFYTNSDERTVMIYVYLEYEFGYMRIEFYLNIVTVEIISLLKKLLSNDTAHEVLKPPVMRTLKDKGIDIFTLFDTKENDVEDDIEYTTKKILEVFIKNIPFIARSSVVDALSSSIVGYSQNTVRELLKEHWSKLGLPKNFNLLLDSDIEKIRKLNIDRKKWFLGSRKQLLNEWAIIGLADEAENLRKRYQSAKKRYKEAKKSYESLNKRPKDDEWHKNWSEKWLEISLDEFPGLYIPSILPENIEFRPAYELALTQLAGFYNYDEEYMKKKITRSRKLKLNSKKKRDI
jgi:hypothetical protein